jgi:hypothetical protein
MSRPEEHLQPPDEDGDIVDQQAMDAAAGPARGGTTLAGTMQTDEDDAAAGGQGHPASHQGTQSAGEALSGEHGSATSPATPTPATDPGSGGSSGG